MGSGPGGIRSGWNQVRGACFACPRLILGNIARKLSSNKWRYLRTGAFFYGEYSQKVIIYKVEDSTYWKLERRTNRKTLLVLYQHDVLIYYWFR